MSGQSKLKCVLYVMNILIATFVGQNTDLTFLSYFVYFHCFMNCYFYHYLDLAEKPIIVF